MQTTLLGIAIAIILALVTALVGPLFVDWNKYRGEFEARASRLTGLECALPGRSRRGSCRRPTLTLQRIEIARPGDAGALRARKLGIEFALSSLMRGEWRADRCARRRRRISRSGSTAAGHIDWPAAIDRLRSRRDLDRAARYRRQPRRPCRMRRAASRLVLEKLEFKGELRSLAGPVKGEGSFVVAGQHYPYRIVREPRRRRRRRARCALNIDPIDRPLIADVDAVGLDRERHSALRGHRCNWRGRSAARRRRGRLIIEPWRVTSQIKGDSTAAVLEQIEFQYGPDDRAIKLRGDAKLTFGAQPQLSGVLSSTQIDLDRMLALPEAARRAAAGRDQDACRLSSPAHRACRSRSSSASASRIVTLAGATLAARERRRAAATATSLGHLRSAGFPRARRRRRCGSAAASTSRRKGIAFAGPAAHRRPRSARAGRLADRPRRRPGRSRARSAPRATSSSAATRSRSTGSRPSSTA